MFIHRIISFEMHEFHYRVHTRAHQSLSIMRNDKHT